MRSTRQGPSSFLATTATFKRWFKSKIKLHYKWKKCVRRKSICSLLCGATAMPMVSSKLPFKMPKSVQVARLRNTFNSRMISVVPVFNFFKNLAKYNIYSKKQGWHIAKSATLKLLLNMRLINLSIDLPLKQRCSDLK